MADSNIDTDADPKKKKYLVCCNSQKEKWPSMYPFINASRRGEYHVYCNICYTDFSIGHGGENYIKRHQTLKKHVESVEAQKSSQKLVNFVTGSTSSALNEKLIKAELFFLASSVNTTYSLQQQIMLVS